MKGKILTIVLAQSCQGQMAFTKQQRFYISTRDLDISEAISLRKETMKMTNEVLDLIRDCGAEITYECKLIAASQEDELEFDATNIMLLIEGKQHRRKSTYLGLIDSINSSINETKEILTASFAKEKKKGDKFSTRKTMGQKQQDRETSTTKDYTYQQHDGNNFLQFSEGPATTNNKDSFHPFGTGGGMEML